jgi:GWxTD domain-containing protein
VKRIVGLTLLLILSGYAAGADDRLDKLTPEHRKWLEEEVTYIITKQETEVFLSLETVEERNRFIEAFWDRRDPTPATPDNEFKKEHYRRLDYANGTLGRDTTRPGWKTDRGKFYIILGEPREIQRFDGSNDVVSIELWFYEGDTKVGMPPRFNLLFFKENDVGEYQLYHPYGDGPEALLRGGFNFRTDQNRAVDILEVTSIELARASLTVDLTEPVDSFLSASNTYRPISPYVRPPMGVENTIAKIEESPLRRVRTDYLDAYLRYKDQVSADYSFRFVPSREYCAVFNGPENTPFVHYAVELDPENFTLEESEDRTKYYTTLDVTVEIRDKTGTLVATSENSRYVELTRSQMQAVSTYPVAYHDTFPLLPGDYDLSLVVKNRATKQFTAAELALRVEPPSAGPALGGIILGYKTESGQFQAGHQVFQLGDEIVYPSLDASFTPNDTLYVLAQVSNATRENRVHLSLWRAQEKVQGRDVTLGGSEGGSILEEFPLTGLDSGSYQLRIELLDASSKTVAERTSDFTISPRSQISRAGLVFRHSFNSDVPGLLALARGQQYMGRGRLAEAEEAFTQAVAAGNPDLVMAKWKLANVYLYSRRADDALNLLLPIEKEHSQEPELVDTLGLAYYMKGDYRQAVGYLERSVTLRPPQSPLLNALADSYQSLGEKAKAKEVFERSLALNPEQPAVKERLASIDKSP